MEQLDKQKHWGMVCLSTGVLDVCVLQDGGGGEWDTEGIVFWLFFLWPCEGAIPHAEREGGRKFRKKKLFFWIINQLEDDLPGLFHLCPLLFN